MLQERAAVQSKPLPVVSASVVGAAWVVARLNTATVLTLCTGPVSSVGSGLVRCEDSLVVMAAALVEGARLPLPDSSSVVVAAAAAVVCKATTLVEGGGEDWCTEVVL